MRRLLPFVLAAGLSVAAVAPAAAAPQTNIAAGGGLISVVVQAVLNNVDVLNNSLNDVIEVNINDSLNNALQNVLQNADIDVLNNSLNNVLNNLNIDVTVTDITVIGDSVVVTVLGAGGVADTIVLF
jgi:ABC-type methionine transport system permease subunit